MKDSGKSEKKQTQILETSLRLFNERGINCVSTHDIARDLGISAGNITYYFSQKSDIVNALFDRMKNEYMLVMSGGFQLGRDINSHIAIAK